MRNDNGNVAVGIWGFVCFSAALTLGAPVLVASVAGGAGLAGSRLLFEGIKFARKANREFESQNIPKGSKNDDNQERIHDDRPLIIKIHEILDQANQLFKYTFTSPVLVISLIGVISLLLTKIMVDCDDLQEIAGLEKNKCTLWKTSAVTASVATIGIPPLVNYLCRRKVKNS